MNKFNPVIEDNPNMDLEFPPTMKPLLINSNGSNLLGSFFKAAGKDKNPLMILLHGFPGNETNFDIAHAVRRYGYNAAVFHYRGSWGSGGGFSISNSLEDVNSVIDFFGKESIANEYNVDKEKIVLVGHSMGGFLALMSAINNPKIKNIASLAGFNFGYFTNFINQNPQHLNAVVEGLSQGALFLNGTNGQEIYNEMINNINNWDLTNKATELKEKNILLIAAENDDVAHIPIHHTPLVESFKIEHVQFKSEIYKTGHSFSSTRIRLATEIINWLKSIKI